MSWLPLKALTAKGSRGLYLLLTIALAAALITAAYGITQGLHDKLDDITEGTQTTRTIYIVKRGVDTLQDSRILPDTVTPILQTLSDNVIPQVRLRVTVDTSLVDANLVGVDTAKLPGGKIEGEHPASGAPQILLGTAIAETLNKSTGEELTITHGDTSLQATITGILEKPTSLSTFIVTSIETSRTLDPTLGLHATLIEVHLQEDTSPQDTIDTINTAFRSLEALPARALGEAVTETQERSLNILSLASAAIILLTLLLVYQTTLQIAKDSTHEIGIMQALGATPAHLTRSLAAQALLLTALGTILGTALGALLSNGISLTQLLLYPRAYVQPHLTPDLLLPLGLLLTTTSLASLTAIRRIVHLTPREAMTQ